MPISVGWVWIVDAQMRMIWLQSSVKGLQIGGVSDVAPAEEQQTETQLMFRFKL